MTSPPAARTLRALLGRVLAIAGAFALAAGSVSRAEDDLDQSARKLREEYGAALAELAAWCEGQGLGQQATRTRARLEPRDPSRLYVAVLPEAVGPPPLADGTPAPVATWNERLGKLRRDYAAALFDLARRAARAGRASLALKLVLDAAREDPDHEGVRRLLGYQEYRRAWRTRYEIRKLRSGHVWHARFGWLPKAHVPRYEKGERYYKGRWVTAEEDARLHADIHNGWDVETEHYVVRTNHSIEAGVDLGAKLERLYRVWKQLFVRYFASERQLQALFDSRSRAQAVQLPRHNVVFFRDRDDYNRALRAAMPNIGVSIGVYVDSTRRAYFFAGEGYEDRTLYHEATHQLFHESRPVARDVGREANFWIVEGIAMLMESLQEEDGFYTLGGFDDARMVAARYRLLHDGFYVPLGELCGYGMTRIQGDKRIATLYSQAAGLTHFLVFHEDGEYRDALIAYLSLVYSGRDDSSTLARLTGVPYAELDRQYRDFMERRGRDASDDPQGR